MYALLTEHANADKLEEINRALDADDSSDPDEFAALLQQAIADDE